MKKTIILFAIAFVLVGFSQAFAQQEIGTWKIVSTELKGLNEEAEKSLEGDEMSEKLKAAKGTFTFMKGGKFSVDFQVQGGEPIKNLNKYKLKEGVLSFEKPDMNLMFFDEAILKVDGNKATLTQPDMEGASLTFNLEKIK